MSGTFLYCNGTLLATLCKTVKNGFPVHRQGYLIKKEKSDALF
jgi:hypothetical protein